MIRASNSGIPLNTVSHIAETSQGIFWVGFSFSTQPGGEVARFDGSQWRVFDTTNSGYNGSEPTSLALDSGGRLWIGSAVDGLEIYKGQ